MSTYAAKDYLINVTVPLLFSDNLDHTSICMQSVPSISDQPDVHLSIHQPENQPPLPLTQDEQNQRMDSNYYSTPPTVEPPSTNRECVSSNYNSFSVINNQQYSHDRTSTYHNPSQVSTGSGYCTLASPMGSNINI